MSSLWQEFQTSSPLTKVVTGVLVVGIVAALCCVVALAGVFLFSPFEDDTDIAAQGTPNIIVVTPAPPQLTPQPSPTIVFTDWQGEYYNNVNLEGEPVVVRNDPAIDFNWGTGPPAPGVEPENFSVRWLSDRDLPAGIYRIAFRVDNGVRLWIDDTMIIDEWFESEIRTLSADVNLVAGPHNIRVEYFHSTGHSLVQGAAEYLDMFPDWKAEYWNNPALSDGPVVVRNEQSINYNWGATSPIPGAVNDNDFSIRWTRTAHFDTDKYIFRLAVEGGARVWFDGQILIDSWDQTAFRELEATKDVSVGSHGLRVEYYKTTGNGQIHFGWAELDDPGEPPLAVINGPVRAVVGQPVIFTARNSGVADGHRLVTFEWDFGDGTTGSGIDVTHVYNNPGKFAVTLKVTDDKGLSDTSSEEIEILPTPTTPQPDQAPIAIIIAPSKARVGDVVTFDASQSVCSNPCVSFAWDFGDGSTANAIKVQHVYRRIGDYNVTLTLTDNKGLQGSSNTVVGIRDAAATATPVPATETPVGPTATPGSTDVPTEVPTDVPPEVPTDVPTEVPPEVPTEVPTDVPPEVPTEVPTEVPPEVPTDVPTEVPPEVPTEVPTEVSPEVPTEVPPEEPTPTDTPTLEPTVAP